MPKEIKLYDPCTEILCVRISTRFNWENALRCEDRSKVGKIFKYLRDKGPIDVYLFGSFGEERLFRGADGIPNRLGRDSLHLYGLYSVISLLATGELERIAEVETELAEAMPRERRSPLDYGTVRFKIKQKKPKVFEPEDAARFLIRCTTNYQVSPIELYLIPRQILKKYLNK